jgi:hypothetical protein
VDRVFLGESPVVGDWWQTIAFRCPEVTGHRITVDLECRNAFVPRRWNHSEDDRTLGVVLREIRIVGSGPD